MKSTPENSVARSILLATQDQVCWFRNNSGVAQYDGNVVRYGCGGPGCSDYLGIRRSDGRFVAMEVKSERGRATAEQLRFLDRVRMCGGIAFIARSVSDALEALA